MAGMTTGSRVRLLVTACVSVDCEVSCGDFADRSSVGIDIPEGSMGSVQMVMSSDVPKVVVRFDLPLSLQVTVPVECLEVVTDQLDAPFDVREAFRDVAYALDALAKQSDIPDYDWVAISSKIDRLL